MTDSPAAQRPVAVVTGGSSGIGAAVAIRLAHDGFDVGLTYKSGEDAALRVAAHIARLGVRAEVAELALDGDPGAVARSLRALLNLAPGGVAVFDANALSTYRGFFASLSVLPAEDRVLVWPGRGAGGPEAGRAGSRDRRGDGPPRRRQLELRDARAPAASPSRTGRPRRACHERRILPLAPGPPGCASPATTA